MASIAGMVWCHGGAFAFGDLDMPEANWVALRLAEAGIQVVSVDYQLAGTAFATGPGEETHDGVVYPIASEEVGAAFEWTVRHLAHVPAERWSLGGASAGANLAAGAALRLRDRSRPLPRSLVLAYPLVHSELPSHRLELSQKVATLPAENRFPPELVQAININYVGDPSDLLSSYAFPGSHNLQGMPPTFILNSDADDLRSSGELFASELAAAGVDLLMIRENGTRHGHLNEPDNPAASRSLQRIEAWLTSELLLGVPHETI
ncbi:MAG: alpha/beta hydrolase [Propionibacteriaceae bacterium]